MSEPTSTSSPRSGSISDDGSIFAFDGAEALLRAWGGGLKPDPLLTVSEWADRYRTLSSRAAAEPGRYRTQRTPYMKDIMDALSPGHPAQRIVFMKAAQVGATEAGNCFLGFIIHQAPGPALAVQPTVELAKRNSRQRIDPLIEESPALRDKVKPARSRDAGNTMLSKEFAGGILIMTGANSAVGLRSTPARYIFLDEVDAYPASADEEGDPVSLAEARSLTFAHRRKVFLASTPTIRGLSAGSSASTRRPTSGGSSSPARTAAATQWLKFERLRWEKGKPETAAYACEGCDAAIAEHHKTAMLEAGEWRATATSADPATIGFHLSALYSPVGWLSWERIARAWEAAQGSDEAIRAFRNTILGETWVETGEAPDWRRLYDRREHWPAGTVPKGGLFLTAGADVQKDRIEVDVWAWGRGLESWLVDHVVIDGGPEHQASLGRARRAARPDLAARPRGAAADRPARDRHRLRGAGGLCLGAAAGLRAGRADQGRRGLQPGEPGVGPDLRRRDGRRQAHPSRRPALDGRGLDLQGRDLPLPAARPADGGGARRRCIVPARERCICRTGSRASG